MTCAQNRTIRRCRLMLSGNFIMFLYRDTRVLLLICVYRTVSDNNLHKGARINIWRKSVVNGSKKNKWKATRWCFGNSKKRNAHSNNFYRNHQGVNNSTKRGEAAKEARKNSMQILPVHPTITMTCRHQMLIE